MTARPTPIEWTFGYPMPLCGRCGRHTYTRTTDPADPAAVVCPRCHPDWPVSGPHPRARQTATVRRCAVCRDVLTEPARRICSACADRRGGGDQSPRVP